MTYCQYFTKLFSIACLFLALTMFIINRQIFGEDANAGTAIFSGETAKDKSDGKDKKKTTTLPEVLVTANQDKRKSYKPGKPSSNKYTGDLIDIPQTITIVPQVVAQEQNATTLREVLRNVPGISMQAGEGGVPAGDNLSIRGFNARTDIFIDGVRDFGGYTRDPFNFEQVEVAKGPASSYSGRGSTGGTVNLVSKAPELESFYRGDFGIGTAHYERATLDLNQPLKNFPIEGSALRLNMMWHDANVPGRDVIEDQRWGIAPSIAFGIDTPTRTTISYFQMNQDNLPSYGIPWIPAANVPLGNQGYGEEPAPVDWSNFYGLEDRDYEDIITSIASVKVERDVNDALTLRNQFRWGWTSRDSIITAPRLLTNTRTDVTRQAQSRDQDDGILDNQLDAIWKFGTFGFGHTLVTGTELIRETSENRPRTIPNARLTSLYDPNLDDGYTETITKSLTENESTSKTLALYLFDTIDLSEKWQVLGGLRWDNFHVNFTDTVRQNFVHVDNPLSWRTGLVYKPLPNGSIYFGYGTSVNPSAEGLTLSASTADLKPEKSTTYEIGTKWDFLKERLGLNSAFFVTDKENARTPGTNPGDAPTVLEGEQRVVGIEFGASGSITSKWKVFSAYTILGSWIRETGTPSEYRSELTNTPGHSFNVWSTYQLPFNFEAGAGLQYVDNRFANTANTRVAPAYLLFDAMLAYKLNDHWTLRLNGYNLTDQEYISSVGGGHFIPGNGRAATLTTSFEF